MSVLQSLYFRASSGECLLVVGMEEEAVTNCVAMSLKEQFDFERGKELGKDEGLKRRYERAQFWMEKLIQIRIPVPNANPEQIKALLTVNPRKKGLEAEGPVTRHLTCGGPPWLSRTTSFSCTNSAATHTPPISY